MRGDKIWGEERTVTYFVIGLSDKGASLFEDTKQTILGIATQKFMTTELEVSRIKQAGAWSSYDLAKHSLIVHSISRSDFHDESYEQLADKVSEEPYKFVLLNSKAMDVISAHGFGLAPILGSLEDAELPANLTTDVNILYPELRAAGRIREARDARNPTAL
jgi:hypothetical protein